MSKKWIVSDLHFSHRNILKYSGAYRGGTTSEEHDEWLINQINSVVKKNDLLYVLGDIAMKENALQKLKKIKGQKLAVRGNHDIYATQKYLEYFQQVHGMISYRGVFWLTHCPIHPQELRGRINIHGHVHQNSILGPDGQPDPRYINACVETTYGIPQSLDDLYEKYAPEILRARAELKAKNDQERTEESDPQTPTSDDK